jgi:alpha-L-fucosidase
MPTHTRTIAAILVLLMLLLPGPAGSQLPTETGDTQKAKGNKPERVSWFAGLGFGMFIHWRVDSQLGLVISHSLVGADEDYCRRFFEDLPRTFNPRQYRPDDWAELARLTGFKYVVFTAKHHSGFCMFRTATTPFNIINTP